ncbi:hypothetical protein [Chondromyces apiculatus]|uniref:Uncharacterized protein n=1 Tax=Chondromyces apiculatus DSM 436 TaxID=1192034 RepID=A0A017TFW3_9BACT|nr:hypothetical protein [Chondromyces apiculatus]EYF08178.1 Hypothetical protein CAP_5938 [Chondromyces apiculatus DSM 436]
MAIYGASFQARLVINMALLTPRLFIPKEGHSPVTFCATQEEGRPFLAETRAERRRAGRDDDSQA